MSTPRRISPITLFSTSTAHDLHIYLMNSKCDRERKLRLLDNIKKQPGAEILLKETLELTKAARTEAMHPRGDDGVFMCVAHPTDEEQNIEWVVKNIRRAIKYARVEGKGYADDSSSSIESVEKQLHHAATKADFHAFQLWRKKKTMLEERELAMLVREEIKLAR